MNKVHIINTSDSNALINYPGWFNDENGVGLTFESSKGFIDLDLLCKGDGTLKIEFKGIDINDYNDHRIPDYVNYTEILLNGKKIINQNKLTCHDKPFIYTLKVKNDE